MFLLVAAAHIRPNPGSWLPWGQGQRRSTGSSWVPLRPRGPSRKRLRRGEGRDVGGEKPCLLVHLLSGRWVHLGSTPQMKAARCRLLCTLILNRDWHLKILTLPEAPRPPPIKGLPRVGHLPLTVGAASSAPRPEIFMGCSKGTPSPIVSFPECEIPLECCSLCWNCV